LLNINYFVLGSKAFDNFDVVSFSAVFGEDNILGFNLLVFAFEGFADFVDTFSKEWVSIGSLYNSFEGLVDIKRNDVVSGHMEWK
jgi:hypothetical protein